MSDRVGEAEALKIAGEFLHPRPGMFWVPCFGRATLVLDRQNRTVWEIEFVMNGIEGVVVDGGGSVLVELGKPSVAAPESVLASLAAKAVVFLARV